MTIYDISAKLTTFGCYSDMAGIDFIVQVEAGDYEKAKQLAEIALNKWCEDYICDGYIDAVKDIFYENDIYATFYDKVGNET